MCLYARDRLFAILYDLYSKRIGVYLNINIHLFWRKAIS